MENRNYSNGLHREYSKDPFLHSLANQRTIRASEKVRIAPIFSPAYEAL